MNKKIKLLIIILFIIFLLLIGGAIYEVIELGHLSVEFFIFAGLAVIMIIPIIISFAGRRSNDYVQKIENRLNLWNTITYKVKGAGETAFNNLPIGIIVLDNAYRIVWANKLAEDITKGQGKLIGKQLESIVNGDLYRVFKNAEEDEEHTVTDYTELDDENKASNRNGIELFEKYYQVRIDKNARIIYLRDMTEERDTKRRFKNEMLAFGYINIDNLEESIMDLDVQIKSECKAKIAAAVINYVDRYNGSLQAISDSRYIMLLQRESLRKMIDDKFSIMDEVKIVVKSTKATLVTISMGIACLETSIVELTKLAQDQLELAFSRGGDQVVVLFDNKREIFGAKSDPIRKESKVNLRFKYQELEATILKSTKVFCVGHTYQDADAFGSALLAFNLCQSLGKESYIVLDENSIDKTVEKVLDDIKRQHPTLAKSIISPEEAKEKYTDNSLLLCVDFQAQSQLFNYLKIHLSTFKRKAVIDHHRKNEGNTIEDLEFYYCEPGASSTVELLFTLLEFCEKEIVISSHEATWMLLGLVVDTNNFSYRTTKQTFEVAALLNKYNASTALVKNYLKETVDEKRIKSNFVLNAEYMEDGAVAIAVQNDEEELKDETISKISDELLMTSKVKLAVTVGYKSINPKIIKMSARSLGDANCQVLMEKFGGGGHYTQGAAQIKDQPIEEVVRKLKMEIKNAIVTPESLRIILVQDVRSKGKLGDVVELDSATANDLIRDGRAVLATPENVRILEEEKKEEEQAIFYRRQRALTLKQKLEEEPIKVYVKTDEDGKLQSIVSIKVIGDEIDKKLFGEAEEKIDRRKITLNKPIESLGNYYAQIELDDNIFAKVGINVIEK